MRIDAPPTVKQIYAIAAALCEEKGDELPRTRGEASELIRKLRGESGGPRHRAQDEVIAK